MFNITNLSLSDRIYPTECTYIRIEGILWLKTNFTGRQIPGIMIRENRAP